MWEKDLPGHSLLHSSYLYPGAWYIDGVAGIKRDPDHPGFRHFIIRPPHLNEIQMQWAEASFDSPSGIIKTHWQRQAGRLSMRVTIPPNCTATLQLASNNGAVKINGKLVSANTKGGYRLVAGTHQINTVMP
ncbi:alpha-L-rhamnosidase C-terminal domain-containing protein [Mucilaginibacter myungsuensis]|uniref:alpha-L-rhamnosidase C-terminal domain-containing protein n=1 Tax=Mucilaginibacter myungsuensis TaxID=649104 RepID=UPI001D162836|nr:alpha-L-rhamnosidase C-terminal domain-containing protein [Mucilaginibacter myungsuensis]MDN3597092.1 alpha-L-rhamnosidase C-terminal domain-containing protein [Mucilaginibacter myungsuensis]